MGGGFLGLLRGSEVGPKHEQNRQGEDGGSGGLVGGGEFGLEAGPDDHGGEGQLEHGESHQHINGADQVGLVGSIARLIDDPGQGREDDQGPEAMEEVQANEAGGGILGEVDVAHGGGRGRDSLLGKWREQAATGGGEIGDGGAGTGVAHAGAEDELDEEGDEEGDGCGLQSSGRAARAALGLGLKPPAAERGGHDDADAEEELAGYTVDHGEGQSQPLVFRVLGYAQAAHDALDDDQEKGGGGEGEEPGAGALGEPDGNDRENGQQAHKAGDEAVGVLPESSTVIPEGPGDAVDAVAEGGGPVRDG